MIYWMSDHETTGFTPIQGTIITSGSVLTDDSFNILDRRYHTATVGQDRFRTNSLGREYDIWNAEAEKIHGITWEQQKEFPEPIEMCRDIWRMLEQFPDEPITYVYHANGSFDISYLMYFTNLHAPKLYMYLNKRLTTYEMGEHSDHINQLREFNTMTKAREYIKKGKNTMALITKQQKIIDRMIGYLEKDRKVPAKPEKIREWMDKKAAAENEIALLNTSDVVFEGYSLDKICKALGLKLEHHNAMSDAEALVPITKFLTHNLQ
jgi:DNA polymerase III epsilon subunit-like protein